MVTREETNKMRKELGDKLYGIEGSGNRQAGKLD